ncbi:CoF synthetase [Methanocella sp. CWC-04]|uniref:CoF synthetase n=1 Tax=Methanooceanicella nereidis TaxID=2052831 RepID=A0AAP2W6C4_9EURY|nr:phenylacetate--CoA ligase family protein [Methanocella sp. CWC-04]MCD1295198.1 CoF synthetase [Methanocella sp. CWC-04]
MHTHDKKYWNKEQETMRPEDREKKILKQMKHQLDYVYNNIPFYRKLYDSKGFKPEMVKSLKDFTEKVPIIKKSMLRESQAHYPPYGDYWGNTDVYRIHGSSGTTGTPTLYSISKKDWDYIAEVQAMCYYSTGIRAHDTVQVSMLLSLFMGGWGAILAGERIGARTFPIGAGNTEQQVTLMKILKPTVLTCTPTYAIHMGMVAQEMGIDPRSLGLKKGIFLGEPGAGIPSIKRKIEDLWDIKSYDCGSTSEMTPWATNCECEEQAGMHCYTDEIYTEIVDVNDPYKGMAYGEEGALIYTSLYRESQPMIRFWSGDKSVLTDEQCNCGRTYPRMPRGIFGRLDDMLIIRGVNTFPSAIEEAIRQCKDVGAEFQIIVTRPKDMDVVALQVEHRDGLFEGRSGNEIERMKQSLMREIAHNVKANCGINISVEIVGPHTLPVAQVKAKRVVDKRSGVWS